jgi:NAD dependent epimerase/dehydratase family enzyme
MVKLALGEFGSIILEGQKVIPRKLLENGFVFQYADINKALQSIAGL